MDHCGMWLPLLHVSYFIHLIFVSLHTLQKNKMCINNDLGVHFIVLHASIIFIDIQCYRYAGTA